MSTEYTPFIDGTDLSEARNLQHEINKYEGLLQKDLLVKTEAYYAIEHGHPHQEEGEKVNVKNYKTYTMKTADKNKRIAEYEVADRQYQDTASKLLGCYVFFACLNFLDHSAYLRLIKTIYGAKVLTIDEREDLMLNNLKSDRLRTGEMVHKALLMRINLLKYECSKEVQERFTQLSKEIRKDMYNRQKYYVRRYKRKDKNKEFIEL